MPCFGPEMQSVKYSEHIARNPKTYQNPERLSARYNGPKSAGLLL